VTGEVHHVDAGYNIIGMPKASDLEELVAPGPANGDKNAAE